MSLIPDLTNPLQLQPVATRDHLVERQSASRIYINLIFIPIYQLNSHPINRYYHLHIIF